MGDGGCGCGISKLAVIEWGQNGQRWPKWGRLRAGGDPFGKICVQVDAWGLGYMQEALSAYSVLLRSNSIMFYLEHFGSIFSYACTNNVRKYVR
ncbi:predicted protein [Histoplasma mississippiense (nom. inval.)]|uniref:predicted protein n=1 Tax=Ajellomyces capsulatus (strain NAm1 / WU24) TaxID=2059318 RepID=UPI000157C583|nr:predicted protein [Histoplasma mississippiense (nom. inval.)]EDN08558.1 predicted protein [Histoplasma mississippiense (nom. inval.)]